MIKTAQEVPVKIDELSLSLTGWEVEDFRVRVTSEHYDNDSYHTLAVSGVFRFNEFDWSDCFTGSREYPHYPTMLVFFWPLSDEPAISRLIMENAKNGRPCRIARQETIMVTEGPIDYDRLEIRLTAYDYADAERDLQRVPTNMNQIPIELCDESDFSSVHLVTDLLKAFTYDYAGSCWGRVRAAGRVSFGTPEELFADEISTRRYPTNSKRSVQDEAPFERPSPNLVFDIVDDTGFLLDQIMGYVGIQIPVDEHGQAPSRIPRWLVDHDFCPDRYSASPSRVIARIQDN